MSWAGPPRDRDQWVLFTSSLDEVIPDDHRVRVLDEILRSLDGTQFEQADHGPRGARPMPPRVVAAVVLDGPLTRVRSRRQWEAAVWCRVDFRWLAEGFPRDHSTLSIFRKQFAGLLQDIHTQFGGRAYPRGVTTRTQFGFDGTRRRARHARQRTVAVATRDESERKLPQTFSEREPQVADADAHDEEPWDGGSLHRVSNDLANTENRRIAVRRAQAEIARVKAAREPVPNRIPLTDPESRVAPNKAGGCAPNDTPLANVDRESGLILAGDVLQNPNEEPPLGSSRAALEAGFAEAGLRRGGSGTPCGVARGRRPVRDGSESGSSGPAKHDGLRSARETAGLRETRRGPHADSGGEVAGTADRGGPQRDCGPAGGSAPGEGSVPRRGVAERRLVPAGPEVVGPGDDLGNAAGDWPPRGTPAVSRGGCGVRVVSPARQVPAGRRRATHVVSRPIRSAPRHVASAPDRRRIGRANDATSSGR